MAIDYSIYTIGRVVKLASDKETMFRNHDIAVPFEGCLGHVVGFDYVEYDHGISVILRVRWFNGTEERINPHNVEVL